MYPNRDPMLLEPCNSLQLRDVPQTHFMGLLTFSLGRKHCRTVDSMALQQAQHSHEYLFVLGAFPF